MRQLWRSLIQPIQDNASLVWAPVCAKGELQAQEGPLRNFTRRTSGTQGMNYWDRLVFLKLNSIERRMEWFRIIYTWKSMNGSVPSLGFNTWIHPIKGKLIQYKKTQGLFNQFIQKGKNQFMSKAPNCIILYQDV